MSKWRRLALEQMPSLHQIISEAEGPMAMWIELQQALERAYKEDPRDEVVIRQIYQYAHWCFFESRNPDLATAAAYAFYEHLPLDPTVRKDVPRRLSIVEFETLRGIFAYHLGDKELKQFAEEFRQAQSRSGQA